ncbi:rhodocoxin reductase [Rhodotorula toruloides]|uniref:Rhodocoxin reductase n=1 Tax=Rhodotorula toruloides TaxID=5286 RepID=A0A511KJ24_RHOTO|nr:rhodocoxin reductase [Rhodotorula toruloides]
MTTRVRVGPLDLLKNGEMKEIPFPKDDSENKILLSKVKDQYFANSNKCTHYGAPLVKGVLSQEGRLVCPWHGACFNVCSNGDIEDAPGLNALQSFKVETDGSSVYVLADEKTVSNSREPPAPTVEINSTASRVDVLIVGGGPGAAHTIEGLRDEGFPGSIKVVSKEPHLPIDRTKISKALISDPEKLALRGKTFYDKLKVDFVLGVEATKLDFQNSSVELANGEKFQYENLILATGANPVKVPLDGHDLMNIFTVRGVKDAEAITAAIGSAEKDEDKKDVVVVGSSFIGMEVALALADKAKVTVVGMEKAPFEKILGEQIGNGIRKFHEGKGTKFILPAELSHFAPSKTDTTHVGSVHLKDGTVLPADVVIMGTGVKPATQLLKDAGLELEKNQSVKTDEVLEIVQLKGKTQGRVFALGDIATFDTPKGANYVQHWNVASNHGRAIAHYIATHKREAFDKISVFWSAQGQQLRYAGTTKASSWDDIMIDGHPDQLKFVAYYFQGQDVVAAASMQRDPIVAHISELMKIDKMLTKDELKAGKDPLLVPLVGTV